MENENDKPKDQPKDNYAILIERLDAMEKKYSELEKKYDDTLSMNKALLNRSEETVATTEKDSKRHKELEEKLMKGLK